MLWLIVISQRDQVASERDCCAWGVGGAVMDGETQLDGDNPRCTQNEAL